MTPDDARGKTTGKRLPKIEPQRCDKCGEVLGPVIVRPNGDRIICGNCGWMARPRRGPKPEFKKSNPTD